jgi:argininosuccinate lyase
MDKRLWGARFKNRQDKRFWGFQSSIDYDKELAEYDVRGGIAHVKMLARCCIIPHKTARSILKGLSEILVLIKEKAFKPDKKAEDIHSAIYAALKERIGPAADYMHTARSRNDQIALDMKMYAKDKISLLTGLITVLQSALVSLAKKNIDIIIPGLTHAQHAMPVLLSHQLLAYVEMFERDKTRFGQAGIICDEMPLGACALAGTALKIDRRYTAGLLGFSRISNNSIDAVSDRDFLLDIVYAISVFFMHLSRFCEDMILFSMPEFGILDIPEAFCTGSSIMPQKKNPDALELLRASAARAYANLYSVMVMMKGLPLSYNRDMQLDKEPFFDSIRKAEDALIITAGLVKGIKVNKARALKGVESDESIFALDLADYLVKKGLAFKDAHDIVGRIVVYCLNKGMRISSMPMDEFKRVSKRFDTDVYDIFNAKRSVIAKRSAGGTNPALVKGQINRWVRLLKR